AACRRPWKVWIGKRVRPTRLWQSESSRTLLLARQRPIRLAHDPGAAARVAENRPRGLRTPAQRDPSEDLADDPVGDERGHVGGADRGRTDLDHVRAHEINA